MAEPDCRPHAFTFWPYLAIGWRLLATPAGVLGSDPRLVSVLKPRPPDLGRLASAARPPPPAMTARPSRARNQTDGILFARAGPDPHLARDRGRGGARPYRAPPDPGHPSSACRADRSLPDAGQYSRPQTGAANRPPDGLVQLGPLCRLARPGRPRRSRRLADPRRAPGRAPARPRAVPADQRSRAASPSSLDHVARRPRFAARRLTVAFDVAPPRLILLLFAC